MPKKELIDALIANANSGWTEADRAILDKHDEAFLNRLVNNAAKTTSPTTPVVAPVVPVPAAPTTNAPQPMSVDEYINAAPAEFRDVLSAGLAEHKAAKNRVLDTIMNAKGNTFTREFLDTLPMIQLNAIAGIAQASSTPTPPPTTNGTTTPPVIQAPVLPVYNGAATPVPVANAGQAPVLPLPTFDPKK